jgi:hypothetical protein
MQRALDAALAAPVTTAEDVLLPMARGFVRWALEHPAYSQLLFWRPVPGFEPSAAAYAPAVELVELGRSRFVELQDRGLLRRDVDPDELQRAWTVVTGGLTSQQLANAPHEPFETGTFTSMLPTVVEMFVRQYGVTAATRRSATTPTKRIPSSRRR